MASSETSRLGTSPEEGTKAPCRVSTSANISLSGEQTIETVDVFSGDRVLVRSQTDPLENGVYNVSAGTWTRTTDFNRANDVVSGVLVMDDSGAILYKASFTGTYTAGVTSLTFNPASTLGLPGTSDTFLAIVDGVLELHYMDDQSDTAQITKKGVVNVPPVVATPPVGSDPAVVPGEGQWYTKVIDGVTELFYIDSNGSVVQLTNKGVVNVTNILPITPDSATAHTMTSTQLGRVLIFDTDDPVAVTVPEFASEELTVGYWFMVKNLGAGEVTILTEGTDILSGVPLLQRPELATTILLESRDGSDINTFSMVGNDWDPSSVINASLTAPPATPDVAAVFIPAPGSTGAWANHDGEYAIHLGSDIYYFVVPQDGKVARDQNTGNAIMYDASNSIWTFIAFGSSLNQGPIINPDTATTHAVVAADLLGTIYFNSSSPCEITLPEMATLALVAGFSIRAVNIGGGTLSYAFEGTDVHRGIRLVQRPDDVTEVMLEVAGAPNTWSINFNRWEITNIIGNATSPPATPVVGAAIYVTNPGTGLFLDHNREIAIHLGSDDYDFQKTYNAYLIVRTAGNGHLTTFDTNTGSTPVSVN